LRAAQRVGKSGAAATTMHALEQQYQLSSAEIMEIIAERARLEMAVRGGVAEAHLGKQLEADPDVTDIEPGKLEGPPDFFVRLRGRRARKTVECKNAAADRYANGDAKVDIQKTRASQGDPASRFYRPDAFDVVAICMYGPVGTWSFKYK